MFTNNTATPSITCTGPPDRAGPRGGRARTAGCFQRPADGVCVAQVDAAGQGRRRRQERVRLLGVAAGRSAGGAGGAPGAGGAHVDGAGGGSGVNPTCIGANI
eukprot:366564-Chlamydomonas_euryale.AAC.23